MAAPYTLHGIWLSGPTYKAGLMLSMTGQKFDFEFVNLREGAGQKPEYKAKSRWGQVPCLTVAATGRNLCQSAFASIAMAWRPAAISSARTALMAR